MNPSILLMDSDAQTLEQLQGVLRRDNYNVLIAADGHAALQLIRTKKPDLIISDFLLAGLDGYKVWQMIREDEATTSIPILAVSSLNLASANEVPIIGLASVVALYDDFLPKPIDLGRFTRLVQKLLSPIENQNLPTGPSVMIAIEDSPLCRELTEILTAYNFGVELVASYEAVEKAIYKTRPAILLLDYRQPNPTVHKFAIQIKRNIPSMTIVFVATSMTMAADLEAIYAGLICSPFHPEYVARILTQVLALDTLRQQNQMLSHQLIRTNQNLIESQQSLLAQNEELSYVNEQLRELDQLKENFMGMVVHDLKSPLSAVLGAIDFTLIDPRVTLVDKNVTMLNGAIAAGKQMLRLIQTLLEGQRLEEGRIELELEPFDVPDLAAESLEHIATLLTLHHLKADLDMRDDLPSVYADPYMSQRILENLLDNAVKFSPRNTTITISATYDTRFVTVNVADEGPGIPSEQQSEIFNRFSQVKNNDTLVHRAGFGLGLAFCYQATQAMGGRIWVESDGEAGTKFCFTLPIYDEALAAY